MQWAVEGVNGKEMIKGLTCRTSYILHRHMMQRAMAENQIKLCSAEFNELDQHYDFELFFNNDKKHK